MKKNTLLTLLQYALPKKNKIFFATTYSILNKICDIVPEILIGISIDVIVNQEHSIVSRIGVFNPFHQLYLVGAITAILWILESIFEYLYTIAWHNQAREIQHKLRLKTYDHLQKLDLAYFENKTTGGLLSIVQDDINQLEQFLSDGPNHIIQLTVNVIVMGLIFFYISPLIAVLSLLPIPFVIIVSYYFQHKMANLYAIVRHTSAQLSSHIAHKLQGISTIKSSTTEKYELEKLSDQSNYYQQANAQAHRIQALYIPTVRMAIMFGFIQSLVVGGFLCLKGQMPINWYAALVFLTQRFLWPFTSLTTITDMYQRSVASCHRILNILESTSNIKEGTKKLNKNMIQGKITYEDVSFSYRPGIPIINKINFVILPRKIIAFVGKTGSGKSSIIKLLLRFYEANSGKILIDDTNIRDMTLENLRNCISMVSQDMYLVEGSITDNISYGAPNASPEDIKNAAKQAHADTFIEQLKEGYATKIEENGKNLSVGQRQRIIIARAILKKSPILIFDEATSAVDNETESEIQKTILELAKNHTIIIIAHRLSTVRRADMIYVLDQGAISESGNHEELLKLNKIYAQLWDRQVN